MNGGFGAWGAYNGFQLFRTPVIVSNGSIRAASDDLPQNSIIEIRQANNNPNLNRPNQNGIANNSSLSQNSNSKILDQAINNGTNENTALLDYFGRMTRRPTWRETERFVSEHYSSYRNQVPFLNGFEDPHRTSGSSIVDHFNFFKNISIEDKNYIITTPRGRSSLVYNVTKQVNERVTNLPEGALQRIMIDVRGQRYPENILVNIEKRIINKSITDNIQVEFIEDPFRRRPYIKSK